MRRASGPAAEASQRRLKAQAWSVGCESAEPTSCLSALPPAGRKPGAGTRLAGVIMTKAGSKGGNLRDKLDGNELDLSLSDLNEVPVKELVSTTPRTPGAHLLLTPAPRGQAPLLSLSFPIFKN